MPNRPIGSVFRFAVIDIGGRQWNTIGQVIDLPLGGR
jgi:hypothetical protein